jgi:type IV pilus biogenesis protein PilP
MVEGQRNIPLSNQPLGFDPARTQENMRQLNSQVQERMQNLREGAGLPTPGRAPNLASPTTQGGMNSPAITSYANELQEMAERQRNARLLQAQRAEAEAAMALYGILFDARREEEAARREKREREEREREERERAQRESVPASSTAAVQQVPESTGQQQSIDAATRMELPLPRIVTVFGSAGSLRATLLVPYVGEVNAGPGTMLPGERRVVSVTNEGVVVSDPRMGRVSLGFGDMVPAAPPQRPTATGGFVPPAGFNTSTPPPIPQAPQPPQPPR